MQCSAFSKHFDHLFEGKQLLKQALQEFRKKDKDLKPVAHFQITVKQVPGKKMLCFILTQKDKNVIRTCDLTKPLRN